MDSKQEVKTIDNNVNSSKKDDFPKKSHKYAEDIYAAERILDQKFKKSKRFYLIKWQGWDPSFNTWEPEENILDDQLIESFLKSLKRSKKSKNRNRKIINNKKDDDDEKTVELLKTSSTEKPLVLENQIFSDGTSLIKNINGDELRSVKRIAEGLRPISKQQQAAVITNKSRIKNNTLDNLRKESTSAASSSSSIPISLKNKIRLWNNNNKPKTALNKITSNSSINSDSQFDDDEDSEDSNEESECSNDIPPPAKKRIVLNKIIDDDTDEDERRREAAATSDVKTFADDIFVTDITSGFVTVTIKECAHSEGFFKSPIHDA